MPLDTDKITPLLERIRDADNRSFSAVTKHLFDYIGKKSGLNRTYQKYESERKKWEKWPMNANGTVKRNWSLPDNLDDCKSLSYDVYKTVSETGDKNVGLPFHLFVKPNLNDCIDCFNDTFLDFFIESIEEILNDKSNIVQDKTKYSVYDIAFPVEIKESLESFKSDYSEKSRVAFIMMQFGGTKVHKRIVQSIKDTLSNYGISGLRADDKEYHDDLFSNIITYIYGCEFGIAVFERLESNNFNPNVSLEVGFLLGLKKKVCFLKDKTINVLHTDLVGKLYRPFDPQDPENTIKEQLLKWLEDKNLI